MSNIQEIILIVVSGIAVGSLGANFLFENRLHALEGYLKEKKIIDLEEYQRARVRHKIDWRGEGAYGLFVLIAFGISYLLIRFVISIFG